MPKLKHSRVYRGGVTAQGLNFETSVCSASVNVRDESLDIRFDIASKGGGTTRVLVEVGKGDFHTILEEIASKLPQSVGIMTDCASIANKQNLALLERAQKLQDSETARVKKLVEDLEIVEEFVSDKWREAPAGEDEKEERVREQLQSVMSSLRQLH